MTTALYNEIDPFAVRWLRNLISAGHIAPGVVDERSIKDLAPADVAGVGQRHFFAGIAGWSLALRLAGVPDDADVWTGSCPCQGLSDAGKRRGFADERHLWPEWFRLIRECRPAVVFGEQVASSLGLQWLDLVFADLEGAGYACAAADLCAAGAGAPHQRQRLFFVAYADGQSGRQPGRADTQAEQRGESRVLADGARQRRYGVPRNDGARREQPELTGGSEASSVADSEATGCRARRLDSAHGRSAIESDRHSYDSCVGDANESRLEIVGEQQARRKLETVERGRSAHDGWSACDWIPCSDGVSRPVEPIAHEMDDGLPEGMGRVRPDVVDSLEKEIANEVDKYRAREALFDLQGTLITQAMERATGRFHSLHEAPLLLAFLRQLEEQGWAFAERVQCTGSEAQAQRLRVLRHQESAARASRQRELDGQSSTESSNTVRVLSSILARHAQTAWGEALAARAAATHPLAVGVPGRVGLLRGYGNAIVPQVAAAFIRAALEAGA